jgi:hypothetical protein
VANITIYLPDDVEQKAREAAKAAKTSVSKWVAAQVERAAETALPPAFRALAGVCPEFPGVAELRSGYGKDAPRESFE